MALRPYLAQEEPAMSRSAQFAICPVDDCSVVIEAEVGEDYFCPSCRIEMVTACPKCDTPVREEDQIVCLKCEQDLKI